MKFRLAEIPSTERINCAVYLTFDPNDTYNDIHGLNRYDILSKFGDETYQAVRDFVTDAIYRDFIGMYNQMKQELENGADPRFALFIESYEQLKKIVGSTRNEYFSAEAISTCRSKAIDMIYKGDIEIYGVDLPTEIDSNLHDNVVAGGGLNSKKIMRICTNAIIDEIVSKYNVVNHQYDTNVRKYGIGYAKSHMGKPRLDKRFARMLVDMGRFDSVTYEIMCREGLLVDKRRKLLNIVSM